MTLSSHPRSAETREESTETSTLIEVEHWGEALKGPLSDSFPLGAVGRGEGPAAGLRRVAREIAERSRVILEDDASLQPATIHAVRVGTKRVRALWQLHKATANASLASAAIRRLRSAARSLSVVRDGFVLRRLLGELASEAPPGGFSELEAAAEHLGSPDPLPPSVRRECLEALAADAADWLDTTSVGDAELLELGLRRSFAKTRDLGLAALGERRPEELHRWRRWVKYLRYQLEPLATPERATLYTWHAELKELGSLLGNRNDLHNLRAELAASRLRPVLEAIDARDRVLEAALPRLEETVLHQSPDRFVDRVRAAMA